MTDAPLNPSGPIGPPEPAGSNPHPATPDSPPTKPDPVASPPENTTEVVQLRKRVDKVEATSETQEHQIDELFRAVFGHGVPVREKP